MSAPCSNVLSDVNMNMQREACKEEGSKPEAGLPDSSSVLPVYDLSDFLTSNPSGAPSEQLLEQCRQLAECLHQTGCLIVSGGANLLLGCVSVKPCRRRMR